jgi:flagellar protein FliO/FliZ
MDLIAYDKIATLVIFLAALGAVWFAVLRHKGALGAKLHSGKRLRLTETTALGPADRAMILSVDGQEFLLVRIKGASPILHPLTSAPQVAS